MIVPDLKGYQALQGIFNASSNIHRHKVDTDISSSTSKPHSTLLPPSRRRSSFSRGSKILEAASRASATAQTIESTATSLEVADVEKRQTTCPSGYTFYTCGNGFSGCCDDNPCINNAECKSVSGGGTSTFDAITGTTATKTTTAFQTFSSSSTARSTSVASSTTESATGSITTTTASTPTSTASETSTATPESSADSGTNVGAIAGGVVGAVAAIALILLLLALFFRRQRRMVDERHAKEAMIPSRPILPQDEYFDNFHATGSGSALGRGHQRAGSTANDIYLPQGGPYAHSEYGNADHFREFQDQREQPEYASPGKRAEGGIGMVPAGILRPPQMLDSTPLPRPGSQNSASRSSVFRENLSEMEDTSSRRSPATTDSPVLGHNEDSNSIIGGGRARRHILAWNSADHPDEVEMSPNLTPRAPPSALKSSGSEMSLSQRESHAVVSPLPMAKSGETVPPGNGKVKRRI